MTPIIINMIISPKKILELNKKHNIISNLCDRELNNPEGAGFDLRVGEVYEISGEGFLGVTERDTPKIKKIADIKTHKGITLKPGAYVLVKTIEEVNLPKDPIEINSKKALLAQDFYPRTSLQRSGIILLSGKTDPGYHGPLTLALKNLGPCNFKLELGARFANAVFRTMEGPLARKYEGQWKGGRVATKGKETQN
ncbi:hypothetical protein ACFL2V_14800 [Pseudomonadota bacterium]